MRNKSQRNKLDKLCKSAFNVISAVNSSSELEIIEGITQLDDGKVFTHEEAKKRFIKREVRSC